MQPFLNPFRPGAGQQPPYLAGRQRDQNEFSKYLDQNPVLQNVIITGLRGVGKTVLLDTLKPISINKGWLWAGTDLSETASISEINLIIRIIADISNITTELPVAQKEINTVGFKNNPSRELIFADFQFLSNLFEQTPGLNSDKLKAVLELVWNLVKTRAKGIVLAYDEAQILKDHAKDREYPLSVLLEVTQYLQKKEIPYLLVLTGLPTLFTTLVETRTYSERMFHVINLDRLSESESKEAIINPIKNQRCPVQFTESAINEINKCSGGYPYFIQFICKETFDAYIQKIKLGIENPVITIPEILRKLDTDFYAGRWESITDRQRDLLKVIAQLHSHEEFTAQDISEKSKELFSDKPFSSSYVVQILNKLSEKGIIYRNRHGKYSFAVPMLSDFILRQFKNSFL